MSAEEETTMDDEQITSTHNNDHASSDGEEPLNFDEEEIDISQIKQLAKMKASTMKRGGMDDLDALLDGDDAPVDENLLYSMKRKSTNANQEETADGSGGEEQDDETTTERQTSTSERKSKKKRRRTVSKKKEKQVKDLEDAVYAQYKRNKTIDEDLPSRPVKYINSLDDLVPKILSHLGPIVNSYACHKRPLRPEIRVDKFVDDKEKLTLKHALEGASDDEDEDSDDDFDLVVTAELKPGAIVSQKDKEDEDEDEDFEPNEEDEDEDDNEEGEDEETEAPSTNTESEESKKEDESVEKPQETTITDTFNEPLPQTMTLATDIPVEEDSAESSENEETVELTKEEIEKKQRKELAKKLALKKYIDDMKEEAKASQAYMSDECEEEDDEGNVLDYRTFDDIKNLDEKEIEEEIADFVTFSDSDSEDVEVDESVEVESEITHISDDSDEDILSVMDYGGDDYDILERRKKISKLTPKQLSEQLEKNQESLLTLKRNDGGYGKFSNRGSKLLNMTLSKIALPTTIQTEKKKELEKKERKEAEEKKKDAEKKQLEAYRNAIKKRKREIEKQTSLDDDELSTIAPTPSLDSISSFSNSQELLSIMQSSSKQGSQRGQQKNSKASFLNKTNHNQKAAKQFAAKQQKLQQKKTKETVSLFSSSIPEKPKKKKKPAKKK